MSDRPVIFSAPMVRALLDGRKTQTRRILKPQPHIDESGNFCAPDLTGKVWNWGQNIDGSPCLRNFLKTEVRFTPGDRLYVREAWAPLNALTHNDPGTTALIEHGFFRADDSTVEGEITRWRPSIHMPRWASRLTLLVSEVRVQRLLDITEQDAEAEGVCHFAEEGHGAESFRGLNGADRAALVCSVYGSHRNAFRHLWESLHGSGAWAVNPWVAAISFTVHRANIDALDIGAAA